MAGLEFAVGFRYLQMLILSFVCIYYFKHRAKRFLLLLIFISSVVNSVAQFCPTCQLALEIPKAGGGGTKFFLYTPPSPYYTPGVSAPLLVSLHGLNEIGDDLSKLISTNFTTPRNPAWLISQSQWPSSRPFIVVSPQLKPDGSGIEQDWTASVIDEVIEYVKTLRSINTNKVYLTGLSLGGQGCMIYAAAYPEKVTAMVPQSGRTNEIISSACSLVNIPMWVFHGTDDPLINVSHSITMVDSINSCPNPGSIKPHLTLIDAGRHEIWNQIYDLTCGYSIYDWMLQFTKNDTGNKPPYVSAGANKRILIQSTPIHLYGDSFDIDGEIVAKQWTQLSGALLILENTNSSILKVSNLQSGTFVFEFRVTDNLGLQNSAQVTLQILSSVSPSTLPVVDSLILINGATNTPILKLYEGLIINKSLLGVSEFNIRAYAIRTNNIRFRVNSNQNTNGRDAPFLITQQRSVPEWQINVGDYVICANPFSSSYGSGTEGLGKCFKVSVFDQPIRQFYPKPGQDLSLLSSWGNQAGGSGTPPTSFIDNFQVFNVQTVAPQNGALTIGGVESYLWVRNGGEMTLNNNFTGVINIEGNGIVNVNTTQLVSFGSVSPTSTIRFENNATTIPAASYGNVILQGAGTTKTLPVGTTSIVGNLIIENDVLLQGAANNSSTINLSGNLSIQEDGNFQPPVKFSINLTSGASQSINLAGSNLKLNQLTVASSTIATINGGSFPASIELGSASGGGLVIQNNAELRLKENHLLLEGLGTLNSQNQTGKIGFKNSRLTIQSASSSPSYIYPLPGADTVRAVIANLSVGGALYVQGTLFVTDSIKSLNGTIHSNGQIALVSTENKTARISRTEGTGVISGAVQFQRFISKGRQYRYIGFPVTGIKVSDLQNYVPVTGGFDGSTTGFLTNPSLFRYQEPTGWVPFPATSNTQEFLVGNGYALYVREANVSTKVIATGVIHSGNFPFTLQAGTSNPLIGWNLIGNPYASPIQWSQSGWLSGGISSSVYVRDNSIPDGRFLIWDGETGDEEFGGLIAQGQAFWIKAIDNSRSLTISESAKASPQATYFRTKGESSNSGLTVSLTHNELIDKAYLKLNDRATTKFNPKYDGLKQKNGYFNLSILSIDSISLAIKNLPDTSCTNSIGLAIEEVKPGLYTLTFAGSFFDIPESEIFLLDTHLDSLMRIYQNDTYAFTVSIDPGSYGKKRFKLTLQTQLPEPMISIEGDKLISNMEIGNQWLFNGTEISGANGSSFTPLLSGDYQVRIKKSTCSRTSEVLSYVVTGIESKSSVAIYPNPAGQSITITGLSSHTHYSIRNTLGSEVQKGELSSTKEFNHIDLFIPSGVYVIILENESLFQRIKFIVR